MDTPAKADQLLEDPDLPNIPCPRNLLISLLSKKYLTALYLVEPSIYPQNWAMLVKLNPVAAWNTLNQSVIQYLNTRYSTQGLHIGKSETAIFTLAQKISENILKDIQNEDNGSSITQLMKPKEGEFDLLVEKLQIVFDIVSSQVAKLTGREVTIKISTDGKAITQNKLPKPECLD